MKLWIIFLQEVGMAVAYNRAMGLEEFDPRIGHAFVQMFNAMGWPE